MPHVDFPSGFRLSTGWHAGRCLSGITGRALGHKAPVAPCLASPGVTWSQREAQHYQLLSLQGNIVVLVHGSEDSEDEENKLVVTSLCHHSNLILWVEGLATGFCKDVHGEVRHDGALGGGTWQCHTELTVWGRALSALQDAPGLAWSTAWLRTNTALLQSLGPARTPRLLQDLSGDILVTSCTLPIPGGWVRFVQHHSAGCVLHQGGGTGITSGSWEASPKHHMHGSWP